jgi:hypothetical protein
LGGAAAASPIKKDSGSRNARRMRKKERCFIIPSTILMV